MVYVVFVFVILDVTRSVTVGMYQTGAYQRKVWCEWRDVDPESVVCQIRVGEWERMVCSSMKGGKLTSQPTYVVHDVYLLSPMSTPESENWFSSSTATRWAIPEQFL